MITGELKLYSRSQDSIWTEPYIARKMLLAHLDYEHDGASRNLRTINKTVKWIDRVSGGRHELLDLGCGPGLYAHAFHQKGYSVTGIDVSRVAIDYGKKWALREKEDISYYCQDYVTDRIKGKFDIAICIYCDFGALVPREQKRFLGNTHRALRKGGAFVFDVFGKGLCRKRKETREWAYVGKSDFWSRRPHFILRESSHFMDENVWGDRTIILENGRKPKEYILWDHYYTEETITELLEGNGFRVEEIKTGLIDRNAFTSNDVLFVKAARI